MGVIIGWLGRTSIGSTQHRVPQTKLAGIAAEESKTAYILKNLLLEEIKEALSTNLGA